MINSVRYFNYLFTCVHFSILLSKQEKKKKIDSGTKQKQQLNKLSYFRHFYAREYETLHAYFIFVRSTVYTYIPSASSCHNVQYNKYVKTSMVSEYKYD